MTIDSMSVASGCLGMRNIHLLMRDGRNVQIAARGQVATTPAAIRISSSSAGLPLDRPTERDRIANRGRLAF